MTILTGVAAGVAGAGLTLLLHLVQHTAYGYTEDTFLVGVSRASAQRRVLALLLAGIVAGAGWWVLRARALPVPKVTAAVRTPGVRLPLGAVTLDACLQIVVVALGASLGREGAPRQVGAALGAWLSDRAGLPPEQRRVLLACGAGAGLAAVYNVPLGGALFTLEVLLASVALPAVLSAVASCAVATTVAWAVLPNRPTYQVGSISVAGTLIVWSVLAGPLLGVAAAGFTRMTDRAAAHRPRGWRLPLVTTAVFTALGGLAVQYPQLLGNGRGAAQLALDGVLPLTTLAALAFLKPLSTAACLGSGATGGRLTPAVATGALLSALGAQGWLRLWDGADPAGFVIVGTTAFLAVTLDAPVTAVLLMLEFTGTGIALLVPMMLATTGALVVARTLAGAASGGRWSSEPPARPPCGTTGSTTAPDLETSNASSIPPAGTA